MPLDNGMAVVVLSSRSNSGCTARCAILRRELGREGFADCTICRVIVTEWNVCFNRICIIAASEYLSEIYADSRSVSRIMLVCAARRRPLLKRFIERFIKTRFRIVELYYSFDIYNFLCLSCRTF